jgi:hypothetical protein
MVVAARSSSNLTDRRKPVLRVSVLCVQFAVSNEEPRWLAAVTLATYSETVAEQRPATT